MGPPLKMNVVQGKVKHQRGILCVVVALSLLDLGEITDRGNQAVLEPSLFLMHPQTTHDHGHGWSSEVTILQESRGSVRNSCGNLKITKKNE